MVLFSLAHLLTLYALTLVVLLFRHRAHRVGWHARAVALVAAVTLAISFAWLAYGLLMPERLVAPPVTTTAEASELFRLARALQLTFFSWPDLYGLTFRPFVLHLPVIGLFAALALIYVGVVELSAPLPSLLRHPALVLIMMMFLYGLFETTSSSTRNSRLILTPTRSRSQGIDGILAGSPAPTASRQASKRSVRRAML